MYNEAKILGKRNKLCCIKFRCQFDLEIVILFQAEGEEETGSQVLKLGKAIFKPKKGKICHSLKLF